MQLGVAGLGRMGGAVAARLAETGEAPRTWTRSGIGATAESPRALALACDIVLTFIAGESGDRAVYCGPEGLFSAPAGRMFVNHATLSPRFAAALAEEAAAHGHRFVEAPVLGTVAPARAGRLVALLGASAHDAAAVAPVLARYCRAVRRLGPPGSGAVMKIVHNAILSLYWGGVSEAFAFGRAAGVREIDMVETIGDSFAAIGQWPIKEPLLKGEGGEVGYSLHRLAGELAMIGAEYAERGTDVGGLAHVQARVEAALAAGWGERDVAQLALFDPATR